MEKACPPLSPEDFIPLHDLYWSHPPFGPHFLSTPPWYTLAGVIEDAIDRREEFLAKNPNMIFLSQNGDKQCLPIGSFLKIGSVG